MISYPRKAIAREVPKGIEEVSLDKGKTVGRILVGSDVFQSLAV